MKSKFKLSVLACLVVLVTKSQIVGGCATSAIITSSNTTNSICGNTPVGDKNCAYWTNDGEVKTYTANNAMPTVTFNVSFHFINHPTQATSFSGMTLSQLQNDVDMTISWINFRFQSCGAITPFVAPPNPSSLVSDSKIRIKNAGIYVHTNTLATTGTSATPFTSIFTQGTGTTLCVYFYWDANMQDYGYYQAGGVEPFVAISTYSGTHTPGTYLHQNPDLIWHEICHALGTLHDHYYNVHAGNYDKGNSYWGNLPGYPVAVYVPDDATLDLASTSCNANAADGQNNCMGNTACREHLSGRQIAAFHFNVAKGVTKKFTQFANSTYPYIPAIYSNNTSNFTFSGTNTVSNSFVFDRITIATGSKITFTNCILYGINGSSKIIVEPGAKLILEGVAVKPISTFTDIYWGGILLQCGGYVGQSVDANGLGVHGILEMNESIIDRALIGVSIGTDDPTNAFFTNLGGGWLIANNSQFTKNKVSLKMFQFPNVNVSIAEDKTTLTNCGFDNNSIYRSLFPGPFHFVELEGVKKVKFIQSSFNGYTNDAPIPFSDLNNPSVGIKGINASIYLTAGTLSSSMEQLDYGVHLMNPYSGSNLGTVIEDMEFRTKNGIYIQGSSYAKIVRNTFLLDQMPTLGEMNTGLYLNSNSGYKVENNTFKLLLSASQPALKEGIVVNSSGTNLNQIYNNTFTKLQQGIWCQNQNWDPSSGLGLKLNCNDFINCIYNMGVQSGNPTEGLNTGIATFQGVVTSTLETHVRNTYTSSTACSNQNKFWQYAAYNQPNQLFHGSFLQTQFQIGPQPNCSMSSQILNIVGANSPTVKSAYCPDQSLLPKAPKSYVFNTFRDETQNLNNLNNEYYRLLDGGSTATLLAIISSNPPNENLKNVLLSKPFLSDEVLSAYFSKPNVSPGHVKAVFEANAPASKEVYEQAINLTLPAGIANLVTQAQQQNKLSPRAQFLAVIAIARDNQSYAGMHKAMWLMDSITVGTQDSLAAILTILNNGDVQRQLIELDLDFNEYDAAAQKLAIYNDGTAQKATYVEFTNNYLSLITASLGLQSLKTNAPLRSYFLGVANDETHTCNAKAKVIVSAVFGTRFPELKLKPFEGTGARGTDESADEEKSIVELSDGINLYPNPTQDRIHIKNGTDETYLSKIASVNGQVLMTLNVNPNAIETLDVGNLPSGIYFVNLFKGNYLVKTSKLVIVK